MGIEETWTSEALVPSHCCLLIQEPSVLVELKTNRILLVRTLCS